MSKKELLKYLNNKTKMINIDDVAGETTISHNSKGSFIPDHPYGILTAIGGSVSGKTNELSTRH